MIFLYRFELLEADGVMSDDTGLATRALVTAADGVRQTLYTHTNSEQAVTIAGDSLASPFLPRFGTTALTYTPIRVQHDGLRLDAESAAGQLAVTLDRGHPVADLYRYDAPGAQVWLTVAMLDAPTATPLVVWIGRVRSAEFDEQMCKLNCMPLQDVLKRPGLTRKYPRTCGYELYDRTSCGVSASAYDYTTHYWKWREDGHITAVSSDGLTLTVAAAANRSDAFFQYGFVVINGVYGNDGSASAQFYPRPTDPTPQGAIAATGPNGGIRRAAIGHSGSLVELITPVPLGSVSVGMRVSLFRGCDKSLATCNTAFSNTARHGGYPYIPLKNVFETGLKG